MQMIAGLFGGGNNGLEAQLARQREEQRISLDKQREAAQVASTREEVAAGAASVVPRGRRLLQSALDMKSTLG